jgi:hypothetical protein
MIPTMEIVPHVANKGGPMDYVDRHGPTLIAAAQSLVDLAAEQQKK